MRTSVIAAQVRKVNGHSSELQPDLLAVEEPLEIRIGYGAAENRAQQNVSVTMRTPGNDFELALGFLYTEGILTSYDQVQSIQYCRDGKRPEERENVVRVELHPSVAIDLKKLQRNFYTTSSCGVCGKSSIESIRSDCNPLSQDNISLSAAAIKELPAKLAQHQTVFEYTGGLHAVALFDQHQKVMLVREDVGRHNAFDKIVGAAFIEKALPLSNAIALLSGRASFELVQKAAMAGIPLLAAVGAPSSLAVSLAQESGMTLIGFLRDGRFNIYCGEERVVTT
jgi:FdhD protein